MASALGAAGSAVILSSSGVGCCQSAANAVKGVAKIGRRRQTSRDRRRTGTSNSGRDDEEKLRPKKDVWRTRWRGYTANLAVNKDYLIQEQWHLRVIPELELRW
jgi:hypothetical protein